jgi:hypothetical protein
MFSSISGSESTDVENLSQEAHESSPNPFL